MPISLAQFRAEFTDALAFVWKEKAIAPPTALRSLFPNRNYGTKYVSIDVQRSAGELIALDIIKGSEGNRNTFSLSDQKKWEPPYWFEYFDATQLDLYDVVLGQFNNGSVSPNALLTFAETVADNLDQLRNKIERAKELQCAEVLMTGIVTLASGDSIDFKRKNTSKVDLTSAGGYWTTGATDVFAQFAAGATFLRTVGQRGDSEFDAIIGTEAIAALFKNTTFLNRQNFFNMRLDMIMPPTRNANGLAYHGTITAESYRINLYSYPQTYKNSSGTHVSYIDPKKFVMIPRTPDFIYAHAAVPRLLNEAPQTGDYHIVEYQDVKRTTDEYGIKSAGLPIPIAVDTIYTAKAVN